MALSSEALAHLEKRIKRAADAAAGDAPPVASWANTLTTPRVNDWVLLGLAWRVDDESPWELGLKGLTQEKLSGVAGLLEQAARLRPASGRALASISQAYGPALRALGYDATADAAALLESEATAELMAHKLPLGGALMGTMPLLASWAGGGSEREKQRRFFSRLAGLTEAYDWSKVPPVQVVRVVRFPLFPKQGASDMSKVSRETMVNYLKGRRRSGEGATPYALEQSTKISGVSEVGMWVGLGLVGLGAAFYIGKRKR